MYWILERTDQPHTLQFLHLRFLSYRPFDCHAAVQGRAVSPSQRRLLENLHEVPAVRFLGSASSTPTRCD
jgi:hypothetical protein